MSTREPIVALRSADEVLPPGVRTELLALGPALVPRLVDLLVGGEPGWASLYAVDLLIDLRAPEAIVPMLRIYADELGSLGDADIDEMRSVRIMVRLPELGRLVVEPALAFLYEHVEEEDAVYAATTVLIQLGIRDERIFGAVQRVFEVDEVLGAGMLARYGDERGAAVIERALGRFEPDCSSTWSKACLGDLLLAHGQLGGVLGPELRERVEEWFREWDSSPTLAS